MKESVYFSRLLDPTDFGKDDDFMTFVLIPKKWWSPEAWGFATSLRNEMLRRLMINYKETKL